MDTFLIVLTCASIALAAVFGASAWRARADADRRSAARVAALSAAIAATKHPASTDGDDRPVSVSSMFAATAGASVSGRPRVRMGIFAVLAATFLVIVAMANRNHVEPIIPAADDAVLELVSMNHARSGATLTVSGLVRNPRAAVPRSRIDAVVFAFDRSGGFLASGRASLDFTNLAPGDESPFVVKVADVPDVARYRVSFRTETGALQHLDRRASDQLQASAH